MSKNNFFGSYCLILSLFRLNCYAGEGIQKSILNCAVEVAKSNFNLRMASIILSKDVENQYVSYFIKEFKGTVIIETKNTSPITQVVIFVRNFQSFTNLLSSLKPELRGKNLFNGKGKYIIVIKSNRIKLDHITSILWTYYVINIVIITQYKDKVSLYTYYPYKNPLNCQNTVPTLTGFWEDVKLVELYPDKMRNMQECPLYISTNKIYYQQAPEQWIPLEVIKKAMVRLLRDAMNFTPILSKRDYVSIDSDRAQNWSESLDDIINGLANISICTIPLGIDRLGLLEYSFPYFRVRIAWVAPPAQPGPPWWRLLSPLNSYLWLILLLVVVLLTSLPFILKYRPLKKFCNKYFKHFNRVQGAAFRVWGVLLGQAIKVAPKRFRDFYIISLWIWFTFVVRNAYQSVLIGALKTDTIVGNFANLKETIRQGYAFGGRAGIYAYFEFDPLIRDGFEIIPEQKVEELFCDVVCNKKKFVIATSLEYALTNCLSRGKRDNECGHILPDSILTVPLVIWMRIDSPFARPLRIWLPRLLESGLLQKDPYKTTSTAARVSSEPSPLTLHQLLSCFLCLCLGIAIAIVVLVLEALRERTSMYTIVRKNRNNEIGN